MGLIFREFNGVGIITKHIGRYSNIPIWKGVHMACLERGGKLKIKRTDINGNLKLYKR